MAIPRYRAKRDKTEGEIVDYFRKIGFTVQPLSINNVPDLMLGYRGKNYLVEIKSPGGKLSAGQKDWHFSWNGQVDVLYSIEDAQEFVYNRINNTQGAHDGRKKEQSCAQGSEKEL